MIKKKFISDHDIQLFQEALKDVHPLKEKHPKLDTTPSISKKPPLSTAPSQLKSLSHLKTPFENSPPIQLNSPSAGNFIPQTYFADATNEPSVKPEEKLFFARPGLQQRQIQKLKKGQIPISASIDLHGMHSDEALQALEVFFSQCLGSPQRCFCIIHGKGQDIPVLKNLVNRFLKQQSQVLAFCSAPIQLGGAGATLVLIKSTLQSPFA